MAYLIGFGIAVVAFTYLGGYVAAQKRRPVEEGAVLGALFGPLGCLIEACLPVGDVRPPTRPAARPRPKPKPFPSPSPSVDRDEDLAAEYLR